MIVFFRAQAQFSAHINRDFWRKLRRHKDPFITLFAVGGTTNGNFAGSIDVDVDVFDKDVIAYEITEALVSKVELFSDVGVNHLEFEEITQGIQDT